MSTFGSALAHLRQVGLFYFGETGARHNTHAFFNTKPEQLNVDGEGRKDFQWEQNQPPYFSFNNPDLKCIYAIT